MNPLRWKLEYQLACAAVCATGGVLGVLLGFIHSPSFSTSQPWHVFVEWLWFPQSYWRWPLFAFLISGLTFYAVHLLKRIR